MAEVFKDRSKAANVLNSSINKNLRKRYKIIEQYQMDWEPKQSVSKPLAEDVVTPKVQFTKQQCERTVGNTREWVNRLEPFRSFVVDVDNRRKELNDQLSGVDSEVCDILHYIELGESFNAYQGYLAFAMLRKTLKRRRIIKDEFSVLQQLSDYKISTETLDEINKLADKLESRKYKPRVLKELFE